jgi:hypothetical protein
MVKSLIIRIARENNERFNVLTVQQIGFAFNQNLRLIVNLTLLCNKCSLIHSI